jgi:hypothetical protein
VRVAALVSELGRVDGLGRAARLDLVIRMGREARRGSGSGEGGGGGAGEGPQQQGSAAGVPGAREVAALASRVRGLERLSRGQKLALVGELAACAGRGADRAPAPQTTVPPFQPPAPSPPSSPPSGGHAARGRELREAEEEAEARAYLRDLARLESFGREERLELVHRMAAAAKRGHGR